MTAHYLPEDAMHLITALSRQHRAFSIAIPLLLWAFLTAILQQRFHRWGMDLAVFALVVTVILLFVTACLYLLATHPGYHFL